MSGETMQGRRLPPECDDPAYDYEPGDYMVTPNAVWAKGPTGVILRIPYGDGDGLRWTLVEYEDETITLSPSIDVRAPGGNDGEGPDLSWHGWLERGVWRSV